MKRYHIVKIGKEDYILASCPSYEIACKRLEVMIEVDRKLAKYYNWSELPKYEIIESWKSNG